MTSTRHARGNRHTPREDVDLRSDAVTLPPPAMREAIARAALGDDDRGEDPTVNRLESLAAEMLGKEAAVLATSGTMANLLAVMSQCQRGQQVLVGDESDIWRWEAVGATLAGVLYQPVLTSSSGTIAIEDLDTAFAAEGVLATTTGLVCIENTHGLCGGCVLPLDYVASVHAFARGHGIPIHLDGARLFNAAIALDVAPSEIAARADTVSFCLSKGLAAPVGSLLAGPADVIARARRIRKVIGGGMRQAGIIAAAGLYALEHMVDRLAEDHATARELASGLRRLPGLIVDTPSPDTNIVFWRLADVAQTDAFVACLREEGVRVMEMAPRRLRAVTHYGITSEHVAFVIAAAARAMERLRAGVADAAQV